MSTKCAAEYLRVSPRRVRKLLEVGDLAGERHAGVWLVDAKSVANKMSVLEDRHPARPLSPRMALAVFHHLECLLDGKEEGDPVNLSPKEQSRVNAYIQRLCDPGGESGGPIAGLDAKPHSPRVLRLPGGSHCSPRRTWGAVGRIERLPFRAVLPWNRRNSRRRYPSPCLHR